MNINEGVGKAYLALVKACAARENLDPLIDRLILEVQAEIACEYQILEDGDEWSDRCPCKTCTARMKLKETADAPSA